jgi:hypothetical protein
MGAHTMGEAYRENSGYLGDWVTNETLIFDENFYTLMVEKKLDWINAVITLLSRNLATQQSRNLARNVTITQPSLQHNNHEILRHNNHATLQRNTNATLQRNNHATLQRNNHAILQRTA